MIKKLVVTILLASWLVACSGATTDLGNVDGETADNTAQTSEPTAPPAPTEEPIADADIEPYPAADAEEAIAVEPVREPTPNAEELAEIQDDVLKLTTVRPNDWVKGADDPLYTIIEYGDFQCPACAALYPTLKRLANEYPDSVRVVFRHLPLTAIHPNAQIAAEAAEAAGAQGDFWSYHDALYDTQTDWNRLEGEALLDYFAELANGLDLDADELRSALVNNAYAERVAVNSAEADAIGIRGTPALFYNEFPIPPNQTPQTYSQWRDITEMELLQTRLYTAPPEMTIDESQTYYATVELESGDSFVIELLTESAPITVNNFVFLANEGWFDDVTFHRVIPEFVAQTGDPTSTGFGGPGYEIVNEVDPELTHAEIGMVAMANSGPDTNGSQWYVTTGDASFLDGQYSMFGRVIEGLDFVLDITPRDPASPEAEEFLGDVVTTVTISEEKP